MQANLGDLSDLVLIKETKMFVSFLKRVFCVDSELSGIIWNRGILAPQETEETFFKTWDPGK